LPIGATRERIGGGLNRPALEAGEAIEGILRPADGFPELAVADHVDAGRGLPADHLGNRLGKAAIIIRPVERLAGLLGTQKLLQSLRPDQAADMGREDALGASLHVPCQAAGARRDCRSGSPRAEPQQARIKWVVKRAVARQIGNRCIMTRPLTEITAAEPLSPRPAIRIHDLHKTFGELVAIDGVSFEIPQGEFFMIVGPSGCGKTTLLRVLAGLETITSGTIEIATPNSQRPVNSMIFQGDSIFPWMTVWSNAAYGLKMRGVNAATIKEVVSHYLARTGLTRFADYYPHQLSGGMRQTAPSPTTRRSC
jgi:ABC-type glutathione transport system ATPase component